ncbi:U32 family peptidase [Romboutsia sp. 1001216sp1]|uniref:peptidase U32 family protein n=1 Tax=unclassified Romboutsia TaxID=2626894 RepID=UPI0018A9D3EA|nr:MULTISPECIES: peptidase U32 family protein [unclassified Romboutsia]MDB8792942.1 U32 family peptidase [Romboutsia sp. 1001216sp1]MDB8795256.1 U32 family peptidase [Romboutsia sp. 1001216sp1]MDB8799065.1 U32 family peptidase [Romboutsia sp. 1001216sp1]
MHNVELLAPVRSLEELKLNITNGADAIYIGSEAFGLNSIDKEFSKDELIEGINFAHKHNKKVYASVNIVPHSKDFSDIETYLKELEFVGIDAIIIAEPGMLVVAKKAVPNMDIHLAEQANVTNYVTAKFWHEQGIKRITLSRELSCDELGQIRLNTPIELDLEAYVHGVMAISYSGRPLISNYIKGKDSDSEVNKKTYSLVEEKRPGEYFPVYEDERGTFIFNSKDLCMIKDLPAMIKSGINSLKIEGKMKDANYISKVVKAYRFALDKFYEDPNNWEFNPSWIEEIKLNNREFTSGFYLENPNDQE